MGEQAEPIAVRRNRSADLSFRARKRPCNTCRETFTTTPSARMFCKRCRTNQTAQYRGTIGENAGVSGMRFA